MWCRLYRCSSPTPSSMAPDGMHLNRPYVLHAYFQSIADRCSFSVPRKHARVTPLPNKRSNRGIRHGRPQHLAFPFRDNIRIPWRSTSVDALIPPPLAVVRFKGFSICSVSLFHRHDSRRKPDWLFPYHFPWTRVTPITRNCRQGPTYAHHILQLVYQLAPTWWTDRIWIMNYSTIQARRRKS